MEKDGREWVRRARARISYVALYHRNGTVSASDERQPAQEPAGESRHGHRRRGQISLGLIGRVKHGRHHS